jgi:hypothetical protein
VSSEIRNTIELKGMRQMSNETHKLGQVDCNFPWAGVARIIAEGTLREMVDLIEKHPMGENLRVWMPVSQRWAKPYEAYAISRTFVHGTY